LKQESWFEYRRWELVGDMNADGVVTISDMWLWVKWVMYLPGDGVIAVVGPTVIGRFLELTPESFGGVTSLVLSVILWAVAVAQLGTLLSKKQRPDHDSV